MFEHYEHVEVNVNIFVVDHKVYSEYKWKYCLVLVLVMYLLRYVLSIPFNSIYNSVYYIPLLASTPTSYTLLLTV